MSLTSNITRGVNEIRCPIRRQTRVFYVSIENMTKGAADRYIKDFREKLDESGLDQLYYENIFIGVREGQNRVEVFP